VLKIEHNIKFQVSSGNVYVVPLNLVDKINVYLNDRRVKFIFNDNSNWEFTFQQNWSTFNILLKRLKLFKLKGLLKNVVIYQ